MANVSVFISSRLLEFQQERKALAKLLPQLMLGEVSLKAWLYEREIKAGKHSKDVYLPALKDSVLYIGIFGDEYSAGTIEEFEKAEEWRIDRHIYVRDFSSSKRDSKLTDFLKQNNHIAMDGFSNLKQLKKLVSKHIGEWIIERLQKEALHKRRFDELISIRERLRKARSEYDDYLRDHPQGKPQNEPWHQTIINRAIDACEDTYDKGNAECRRCLGVLAGETGFDECSHRCETQLAYIAKLRLTRHLVDSTNPGNNSKQRLDDGDGTEIETAKLCMMR